MPKNPLKSPDLYINRELSWLEFNHRVLQEGLDRGLAALERLKFLAIVGSNLDEFFLVRVAWLMQRRAAKVRRRDLAGMTPAEQLAAISRRVHRMVDEQIGRRPRGLRRDWPSTACASGTRADGPTSSAVSPRRISPARSSRS